MKYLGLLVCSLLFFFSISLTQATAAIAQELSVIGYNVESGGDTNPSNVAEDMQKIAGSPLWGLSEVVNEEAAQVFTAAVATPGSDFDYILGTTGGPDKLLIIYDKNRLEKLDSKELEGIGGSRKPLVAEFELLSSGERFWLAVNHFNRGSEQKRQTQAVKFPEWAEQQSLPVVAVGDYNFDYDLSKQKGNRAFDLLRETNVFEWIKPDCLATNSCPGTGTGCNRRYDSILDFTFVSGAAKGWQASSQILFPEAEYCSKESSGYADHRPVLATFNLSNSTPKVSKDELLRRIDKILTEVKELKSAIELSS